MTLTEVKAKIRAARTLMRKWGGRINNVKSFKEQPSEIWLTADEYAILEWGMDRLLKAWVSEVDEDGQIREDLPKRLVRMRGLYMLNDGTDNFLFKGIPVRWRDTDGM